MQKPETPDELDESQLNIYQRYELYMNRRHIPGGRRELKGDYSDLEWKDEETDD